MLGIIDFEIKLTFHLNTCIFIKDFFFNNLITYIYFKEKITDLT